VLYFYVAKSELPVSVDGPRELLGGDGSVATGCRRHETRLALAVV
jgi:hypothetical protein